MSSATNRQILLKSRPVGEPKESNFALVETPIPEPGAGEVLSLSIPRPLYARSDERSRLLFGSVAGQIAKIKGCRVVGIAGSDAKCDYVVKELGFDECINRQTQDLSAALKAACPDGIDVYFDNTAGAILEAVLQQINLGARIPLVGLISQYNAENSPCCR